MTWGGVGMGAASSWSRTDARRGAERRSRQAACSLVVVSGMAVGGEFPCSSSFSLLPPPRPRCSPHHPQRSLIALLPAPRRELPSSQAHALIPTYLPSMPEGPRWSPIHEVSGLSCPVPTHRTCLCSMPACRVYLCPPLLNHAGAGREHKGCCHIPSRWARGKGAERLLRCIEGVLVGW